jgi:threonine/homoserine/homoserine lactone efflux protein
MISFFAQTILISLSGVMAPGAVTAATISQGSKNRWAGVWISIGHGIVEIPLIFLLMIGLGTFLKTKPAEMVIGTLGGLFLMYLGIITIKEMFSLPPPNVTAQTSKPLFTGLILSATNPYFLFWWATVGLKLAYQAQESGSMALCVFAIVHWSCDLIWLTILSLAAFHGTNFLSPKRQQLILAFCGAAMVYFGASFLYNAVKLIFSYSSSIASP